MPIGIQSQVLYKLLAILQMTAASFCKRQCNLQRSPLNQGSSLQIRTVSVLTTCLLLQNKRSERSQAQRHRRTSCVSRRHKGPCSVHPKLQSKLFLGSAKKKTPLADLSQRHAEQASLPSALHPES